MSTPPKKKPQPTYGLSRRHTRRKSREFLDFDYADSLCPADRLWLEKFSREYYQNRFTNTRKDKHSKQDQRRKCYTNENARERDMWNKMFRDPGDPSNSATDNDDDDDDEENQ